MRVFRLTVGPLAENAYLVETPQGAVFIDPGDEPARLFALAEEAGVVPRAILLTHAHFDHVGAVAPLVAAWGVPVYLHPLDLPLYQRAQEAAALWGFSVPNPPLPITPLAEGEEVYGFKVWHLPGHSPGHVAFIHQEAGKAPLVFGGDLLFRGGIGRYDLPGADPKALFQSLKRLLSLPPETEVLPGHGPATTLGLEARTNPFLQGIEWET